MEYGTGAIMAVPGARRARLRRSRRKFGLRDPPRDRGPRRARTRSCPTRGDGRAGQLRSALRRHAATARRSTAIVDWLDERGPGPRARSTTGCATGCSRASATGAARSRSSTATRCGIVPVPEDQLPVRAARHRRTTRRRAARRWPPPRTGSTRRARAAAARRGARPTRWTRSSTRPGTSCATATPHNDEAPWDPRGRCDAGCRSTSTSAASSTRSCT